MPTGFSWDMIYNKRKKKTKKKIDKVDDKLPKKSKPKKKFRFKKRIKDLAVLELKKDVKLSPKVKISANVSVPRCCLSAFLLQGRVIMRFEFLQTLYDSVF